MLKLHTNVHTYYILVLAVITVGRYAVCVCLCNVCTVPVVLSMVYVFEKNFYIAPTVVKNEI